MILIEFISTSNSEFMASTEKNLKHLIFRPWARIVSDIWRNLEVVEEGFIRFVKVFS